MSSPPMSSPDWPGTGHLADALSAFLDGELAPAARQEAEAHLVGCRLCQEELGLVVAARAAIRGLPIHWFRADRFAGLIGDPAVTPFPRRAGWAVAAAAAAAAVAVFLPHEPAVAPPLPSLVDSHAARASVTGDPLTQLAPIAVPVRFGP